MRFAACVLAALLWPVMALADANQQWGPIQNGTPVNGHLTASPYIASPTVAGASCGTPVLTPGAADFAGEFQAKGTTTCAVTFGAYFTSKPFCVVQDETTPADSGFTFVTSGSKYTGFLMGTTASNDFVSWHCIGQVGN
jgi:hypothetical protein